MPKSKSHSGAQKRFKITGSGKIMRKGIGKRHNLSAQKKTKKQKRNLGYFVTLHPGDAANIKTLLSS